MGQAEFLGIRGRIIFALCNSICFIEIFNRFYLFDYWKSNHYGEPVAGKTPMLTWNDSLHLVKEKLLYNQFQNVVSLSVSDETETGSGGHQPERDNLTDWNGQEGLISPS